jgi:hypothetical protein
MDIRTKRIGKIDLTVEQKKCFEALSVIIRQIEKRPEFATKIGAELVLGKKENHPGGSSWAQLNISAFDPRILSSFIQLVMIDAADSKLQCTFTSKNIEGFHDPVFTNIIIL